MKYYLMSKTRMNMNMNEYGTSPESLNYDTREITIRKLV